jgi:prepilin-type N-terminal cleavage/methylation domain-containing protein
MEKLTMKKTGGFSLFELLIVIAVIAVVSAIVTPNIISWRSGAKFRGAVDNLRGDLQMAKVRAVKENDVVTIFFNPTGYKVILDRANHWNHDPGEPVLRSRQLPAGVYIDLANTQFGSEGDKTRFNSRGNSVAGHTVLHNASGAQKRIVVTSVGQIRVE